MTPKVCHSERSEESSRMNVAGRATGFFAALLMNCSSCHSERSEESTWMLAAGRATGFFAKLRITRGEEFIGKKPLNALLIPGLRMTDPLEHAPG